MSIYGESAAEPEAGAELVVPDYTAPAASGPTAMGSDGSSVAAGGAAPAAASGGLAGLALITVAPVLSETNQPAANELATLQTIVSNICLGLDIIVIIHAIACLTVLDRDLDDFMVTAYIIFAIAATGFFGAKVRASRRSHCSRSPQSADRSAGCALQHVDKNLLLFYVGSNAMWFLFMGLTTAEAGYRFTQEHRTPAEKEWCQKDPMCNQDEIIFEDEHPFAEFLPNCLLTVLLGLGIWFGYKLYENGAASTEARAVNL